MVEVKEDIAGKTFGELTVIKQAEDYITSNGKHLAMWKCKCICGNIKDILGSSLKNGNTQSCGCLSLKKLELGRIKKLNKYDLTGKYGIGWTSNTNHEFYFDLEDYDKIKNYTWWENDQGYCIATISYNPHTTIRMHRIIMDVSDDLDIDHKNHNTLDNRKEYLRVCTRQQNIFNSKIRKTNKSGITGVWWSDELGKWRSQITVNGKDIILGWFFDKENAIKARKKAEKKYFGKYRYKGENNDEE